MSRNLRNILLAVLVLALVGAGIYFFTQRRQVAEQLAQQSPLAPGPL